MVWVISLPWAFVLPPWCKRQFITYYLQNRERSTCIFFLSSLFVVCICFTSWARARTHTHMHTHTHTHTRCVRAHTHTKSQTMYVHSLTWAEYLTSPDASAGDARCPVAAHGGHHRGDDWWQDLGDGVIRRAAVPWRTLCPVPENLPPADQWRWGWRPWEWAVWRMRVVGGYSQCVEWEW